ncbi:MAG: helix-turn-helix domain-containing protein [Candidatus Woesearchaeota archaeon]
MDIKPFEGIGLTNAEIKVYLSLLEIGSTKVGSIIEKSDLQSSVVHNSLHKLQEKGLISHIIKGKIKHYKATNPKNFIDFIDEKKKNFEKILPQLLIKQKLEKERLEAEIYQGYKGCMNLLLEVLDDAKKGDIFYFFSADVEPINKEIQDFFRKYDPKRKDAGIEVKGIAPKRLKHLYQDREKKGYMKMKYSNTPIPPNMSIFNNKLTLFTWGEKPIGYLIYSKQLADKYAQYFHSLWNKL